MMRHSSFTYIPESKENAIQKLDDEIRELSERLRLLKAQRNGFTVTYALPAEILCEVFAIIRADKDRDLRSIFADLRTWLHVTHVSQYWRIVALEASHLWCDIDVLPPAAIKEFLIRSGRRDLIVEIFHRLLYPEDVLAEIFAQLPRIQKLAVKSMRRFYEVFPHIRSTPAPNLQELIIAPRPNFSNKGATVIFPVNVDIFQGNTPQLRSLSLSRCRVSLKSSLFINDLTTLDISDCPAGSSTEWLTTIQRMPHLVILRLVSSFRDQRDAEMDKYSPIPQDFPIISLLQLSALQIRGTWLPADLDFLAYLTFPSGTHVIFSSEAGGILRHDRELTSTPLISFFRVHNQCRHNTGSDMEITKIVWDAHTGRPAFDEMTLCLTIGGDTRDYLDLSLSNLKKSDHSVADIEELGTLGPISTATSLGIEGDLMPGIWKALSDQLPNIQEIVCSRKGIKATLRALGALQTDFPVPIYYRALSEDFTGSEPNEGVSDAHQHQGEETVGDATPVANSLETHPPPFESLKILQLQGGSLSEVEAGLKSALTSRRNLGLPIKTIKISRCPWVTDNSVARLKDLVDEVEYQKPEPVTEEPYWDENEDEEYQSSDGY